MNVHIGKYKSLSLKQMYEKLGHGRLGEVHMKDGGPTAFEDKCHYCGKWVTYDKAKIADWIAKGQWDFKNKRIRYCGDSVCSDFVAKEDSISKERNERIRRQTQEQYFWMLSKGFIK